MALIIWLVGIRWVAGSDFFSIEAQSCLRARRKGDLLYSYLLSMG